MSTPPETASWPRVREAFGRALALTGSDRDDFLASLDEPHVRRAVVDLLESDDVDDDFLDPPDPVVVESDPLLGEVVGAYRVEARIGSGGMGDVYRATRADGRYDRAVAVKVLKRGMDTAALLERFALERRALASLDHPNIARLIDAGALPDGRPFIVMELVEGRPIDRYCAEEGLSVRERLQLFLQVVGAVEAAHRKLIVHRDLKPGNVLVDDERSPKLLDFGVAKLLEREEQLTQVSGASRPLTFEYASPEQIRGEVTGTETDVYSLGVVLYELLAGRPPHEGESRTQLVQTICERDPVRPSAVALGSVARHLRGDLDNIVLKALRREAEDRYASARELAEDIRRHLGGFPVEATAPSLAYRAGRFVRRNRLPCAAAALVLLSTVVGVASTVRESRRAATARDEALEARDETARALQRAEMIQRYFEDLLRSPDPAMRGRDVTVGEVLADASRRLAEDTRGFPAVEASIRSTLGQTFLALGRIDEAAFELERSLELVVDLFGEGTAAHVDSLCELASVEHARANYQRATSLLREALEHASGGDEERTARVFNDLGVTELASGRLEEALDCHQRALSIRRGVPSGELAVAESLNNLANALRHAGRIDDAAESLDESLRLRRASLDPNHPLLAQSVSNMAVIRMSQGDLDAAAALLQEGLELHRRLLGDEHPDVAIDLSNLGSLLMMQGEFEAAEQALGDCLVLREALFPSDNEVLAFTRVRYATSLVALGRFEEAEPALVEAYSVLARSGETLNGARTCLERLVDLYTRWGRPDEAARWAAEADSL